MKHTTNIVFGQEQVVKFLNGIELSDEEKEMYIKKFSFNTEIELNAFLLGVNETVGWTEVYQIENNLIN